MVDLDKIKQLVEKYYSLEKESKLKDYNEEATKKGFIEPLFRALGWDIENINEVSVEETISKKRVDYGFRIDGIPKFFLEAKSLREDDIIQLRYVEQAIDYAWMKSCTWAILTNFRTLVVYNAEQKSSDPRKNRFLIFIEPKDYLEKISELMLLSKESIKKGELDKKAEYVGKKELKKSIDTALLDDITNFREILYNNIKINNKNRNLSDEDIEEAVQRIIDRMIFIRNAEDRGLEPEELRSKVREWSSSETGHLLNQLNKIYSSFDKDYDSKLFEHSLCDDLKIDDNTLEEVINGLYESRDGLYRYDFSLISADILGNIYEQYLGRILKKVGKTSKLEASKAKRKSDGIYYTPTYIVDYIVKNTVGEYIKTHKEKDIENVKILDPACGSGSFLLKAYDTLENYWKEKGKLDQTKLEDSGSYSKKVEIVTKNIFGVDLDEKAVEIAQLNLLLKIAEKRKRLPKLQENIKNGNSLIDDEKVSNKAFNWDKGFAEIMKNGGFDVIIGNPPWISFGLRDVGKLNKTESDFYRTNFFSAEYKLSTYALFVDKGISLLREGGYLSLILPDSFLLGRYFSKLRRLILDNCEIKKIILTFYDVFSKKATTGRNTVITLKKQKNIKNRSDNLIKIIKVISESNFEKGIFESFEYKQNYFEKAPYNRFRLFFNKNEKELVEHIEKGCEPLSKYMTGHTGVRSLIGQKQIISKKQNGKTWKKGLISGSQIGRYWLKYENDYINIDPKLLNKGGWDSNIILNDKIMIRQTGDQIYATLDTEKYYHLNNIHSFNLKNNTLDIRYILGLLNSKLMSAYYMLITLEKKRTMAQTDIETLETLPIREISLNEQKPIVELVDKLLLKNKEIIEYRVKGTESVHQLQKEIEDLANKLDELVYKIYGITEEEKKIIEESLK